MKNYIVTVFLFMGFGLFAEDEKRLESLSFVHVVSDVEDKAVPPGKCLLTGTIYYEQQTGEYNYVNKPCDSVVSAFYSVGKDVKVQVDRKGTFSVTVDTIEKYMTFMALDPYAELYETIYLEHYPFKSGHRIELAVYLPLKSRQMMIEVDKPVIYACSDHELDFSLELKAKGNLLFTYPSLPENHTWDMHLDASGKMSDAAGKSYPYLFWEARQQASGFASASLSSDEVIDSGDLLAYLESSLDKLGFNQTEKTDFITYWCPKMVRYNYVQVQFYVDEQCSVIGELNIHPKPDAIRRVYAVFRGTDKLSLDFEPLPLKAKPFSRKGFVVLEWGGSEFSSTEL